MTNRARSRGALKALRKQPTSTVSTAALSRQGREAARERGPADLRRSARKAARTRARGRARSRGPL